MATHWSFEEFDDLTSVVNLNVPSGCSWAEIQAIGGDIRYTLHGVDPSTTFGSVISNILVTGDMLTLGNAQVLNMFRAIRNGADTPEMAVHYRRSDVDVP